MVAKKTVSRGNPGIDLSKLPSLSVLEELDFAPSEKPLRQPLHSRVRRVLKRAIDEHFEHGQTFWTEQMLMERIGVSRITVRQALADLAQEGWIVRQAAKGSVVCKETAVTTLGVFVTDYDSDYTAGLLRQIANVAAKLGHRLQIYPVHRDEPLETTLQGLTRPPREERILIITLPHDKLRAVLESRGYRYAVIDQMVEGYTGPFVGTDNREGMALGLEHLITLGHRRITLLVNEPADVLSVQERIHAFETYLSEHNLSEGEVVYCGTKSGESSFDKALEAMPGIWAQERKPTAIMTVSDPGAWAALRWFSNNGVAVPEQVSVVGFENVTPSRFTTPSLTTIAHPITELAQYAVDLLWANEDEPSQQIQVPPMLVVRESTAPTY